MSDLLAELISQVRAHPWVLAVGCLLAMLVARMIGRVAMWTVLVVLAVSVGGMWVQEFQNWLAQ